MNWSLKGTLKAMTIARNIFIFLDKYPFYYKEESLGGGPKMLTRGFKPRISWISWGLRNHLANPLGLKHLCDCFLFLYHEWEILVISQQDNMRPFFSNMIQGYIPHPSPEWQQSSSSFSSPNGQSPRDQLCVCMCFQGLSWEKTTTTTTTKT